MILHIHQYSKSLGLRVKIEFVDDNDVEKVKRLRSALKSSDRLIWMDYGLSVTKETMQGVFLKIPVGLEGLVFPAPVKDVVDWDTFATEVKKNTTEPLDQIAINFDTTVGTKQYIPGMIYEVKNTRPQIWTCDSNKVLKKLKGVENIKFMSDFFSKSGARWGAVVDTKVNTYFTHECIGNILNMPGVLMT